MFWEAQILDFRTCFIIFSMQNLECNLEGQKIEKKGHKTSDCRLLAQGRRWSGASWGEKQRGVQEPDRELELAIGAWPFVDGLGRMADSDLAYDPARFAHLRWAAD